nr:aspartyl-phosphate phosphatase Spo0E family protein [Lederbergia citrea]
MLTEIEKKRQELIAIAAKTGLTSAISLQYSMELDLLLNQYQRVSDIKI